MAKQPSDLGASDTTQTGELHQTLTAPNLLNPSGLAGTAASMPTVSFAATLQATQVSGPLPPASEFAGYKEVLASAPDRILKMAEKQQAHDHRIEFLTLLSESLYRIVAIACGAGILAYMVYGAVSCAASGNYAGAVALGSAAALTGVASIFVRGRDLVRMRSDAPAPMKPITKGDRTPSKSGKAGRRQA